MKKILVISAALLLLTVTHLGAYYYGYAVKYSEVVREVLDRQVELIKLLGCPTLCEIIEEIDMLD